MLSAEKILEKGKLLIYFMGEESGYEEYKWIKELDKFILLAKGEINKPINLITNQMIIEVNKEFKPLRFYFKGIVNQVNQEIETTVTQGEAKNKIKIGQQEREFIAKISQNAFFLPNGIFSPYVVVVKKAISSIKETQTLPAYIVPQIEVKITIEPDRKKKNLFHLNLAGVKIEILANDKGKLNSLLIPSQSFKVYEETYKKREAKPQEEMKGIGYELIISGKKLGKGFYVIQEKEGNILIEGKTQQILGLISFNFSFKEKLSSYWDLKDALLKGKLNDEKVELKAKITDNKINTYFKQEDKTLEKDFPFSDNIIFLTQNFLIDYSILIKKLSNQSNKKFYGLTKPWGSFYFDEPILIPIIIKKDREEILKWEEKEIKSKRYFIDIAGISGGYIWAQKDKIMKISFPFQATDIYHQDFKNLKTKEIKSPEITSEKYISEEVVFPSGKIKLAGTLTIPKNNRKKHPAVILISGSGPQDRNEDTVGPGGLKFGIFKQIAHILSENGIAVLRYDDRGVGKSGGKFSEATQEDFVQDAKSAIEFLKSRNDILKDKIALIGHSEGAIIALRIAKEDPKIKSIVLLAGTAKTGDEVLKEQFSFSLDCLEFSEKEKAKFLKNYENFLKILRSEPIDEKIEEKIMPIIKSQIKWLKSFMNYNPLNELNKIKAQVLIINGGKDKQVFPHHAKILYQKLKELNKSVTLRIFPNLNHLLIPSETGNYSEYPRQMMEEKRISPELLKFLLEWLHGVFFVEKAT
jgi:hypothetical protein